MKFTPEVIAAIETLRKNAENDFELHRISVLEKDLIAPPVVEVIDDKHQKFNGITYAKSKGTHYATALSLHRAVYSYFYGEIPFGDYAIHHRNLNPADNNISNLQLLTKTEHRHIHYAPENGREKICAVCQKKFKSTCVSRKYCSPKCRNLAKKSKHRQKQNCVICGKEFETDKYHPKKCCSRSCTLKLMANSHAKEKELQLCAICGKAFINTASHQKVYCCSPECSKQLRRQTRKSKHK